MSNRNAVQHFFVAARSRFRGLMSTKKISTDPGQSPSPRLTSESRYLGLEHSPNLAPLTVARLPICSVKPIFICVLDDDVGGYVPGFLHVPNNYNPISKIGARQTAAILLSGASGGVMGPSSIYISIADKLASLASGILVLRLDYRMPARNPYCVRDVLSAMAYLEKEYSVSRFVLVGWSFGGAPVFTVAGGEKGSGRIAGCATIASQTADTHGIRKLNPLPVLLLHGTGDERLGASCSETLYEMYGRGGDRTLKFFPGDDHSLTRHALEAEAVLCQFIMKCADSRFGDNEVDNVIRKSLVSHEQRVELMKRGGDLGGDEKLR